MPMTLLLPTLHHSLLPMSTGRDAFDVELTRGASRASW